MSFLVTYPQIVALVFWYHFDTSRAEAMMQSLIKNHLPVDGNESTSWALMVSFLWIDGYRHDMDVETSFQLTWDIATDKLSLEAAAEIIESHLVPHS